MAARLSIFHKGLILILSPILLETVVLLALYSVLSQTDKQQEIESGYKQKSASVINMSSGNFEACMLLFGMAAPGSTLKIPKSMFDDKILELRQLTERNKVLMENDSTLRPLFSKLHDVQFKALDILNTLAVNITKGAGPELIAEFDEDISTVVTMMNDTTSLVDKFISYNDQRIRESRQIVEKLSRQHLKILLAAFAGNLILAACLILYFHQSINRRLGKVRANTERLRKGEELPPALKGSDEIALLDQAFHAMQQALRESSRKENLLLENAADVICRLNQDNQFTQLNPATRLNWGIDPQLLLGKSVATVINEADRHFTLEQLRICRQTGYPSSFANRVQRRQETPVEYHWSVYVEPVEKQLYCVAHDISAQKEIEHARERYITIVSHDLKKPIASISASFEAVKEIAGLPEKAMSKIAAVSNNLRRLLSLVDELGKRETFSAADEDLEIASASVADLLERAVADVEGLARAKQMTIVCQPLQTEIQVDPNKLMQVLVNLLSNALKFSEQSSEVVLSACDDGDTVVIKVRDHGRGIPESQFDQIFEKFKQVNKSDGKRATGTGLGLPICKQIVEQHGGSITVESKLNEGSTFSIRLPKTFLRRGFLVHSEQPHSSDNESTSSGLAKAAAAAANNELAVAEPGKVAALDKAATGRNAESPKAELQDIPLLLKGAVLVGIPLLFEVVLVAALTMLFLQSQALTKSEILQRQIANESNAITFCYRKMAMALLNPDQTGQYEIFLKNKKEVIEIARHLKKLVASGKPRPKQIDQILKQVKACNTMMNNSYTEQRSPNPRQFLKIAITLRLLKPLTVLTHQLKELVQESSRGASFSPQKQQQLRQLQVDLVSGGLLVNILLGLLLARMFSNDIHRRLELVAENTTRLSREEELRVPPAGSDEIAVLALAFNTAAAELSAARKRERTLFDNSKEVICSFDETGKMTGVNPAASKLWGYAKNELLNTDFLSIVFEDDREKTRENLFAVSSQQTPVSFENRIICKNGSNSDVLWTATRAAGEKEIFCVAHDISARKEADRLRNEFLSIVSHDLRTPLGGILITTAMLEEGGFGAIPQIALEKLAFVSTDVNRLLELINDLLDIEKLEAGMMALTIEQVELKNLAHEFAEKSRKLLEEKQIKLNIDSQEVTLALDKDRFLQALSNLLVSAIDRSAVGADIDVLASRDSEFYSVVIRDHAAPLDSLTRKNIFDRYAITTSESSCGHFSSLSVPLSRSIIKLHGGSVMLSEGQDCGNEFVVKMPLTGTAQQPG